MVKREKSPEAIEDIRLFVVWVPYPLHPNWVYEEDVKDCARWVAEVTGEDSLMNIYHKPTSRGMILLEILKEFTDHGCLLGEHEWSHFLKDPSKEEEGNKTCVYYSIYNTCREAGKDGWRPISIHQKWFKNWSPGKGRFVFPYPEPKYCNLPPEDKTGKQICRRIPLNLKQPFELPSKPTSPLVVGSSVWFSQQDAGTPSNVSSNGNRQQEQTQENNLTSASVATGVATPRVLAASASSSQSPGPLRTKKPNMKPKPVPFQTFFSQPEVKGRGPAWTNLSQSPRSTDPVLQQPILKAQNAWERPLNIVPESPAKIISTPTFTWEPSHESWADIVENEISEATPDEHVSPVSPFTHKAFNVGTESPSSASYTPFAHYDDESDSEDILVPMVGTLNINKGDQNSVKPSNDEAWSKGWSDHEEQSQKNKSGIVCPTHGPACSKKICSDYKKLEWERKKEEERKNGHFRGRGRGRGRRRPDATD